MKIAIVGLGVIGRAVESSAQDRGFDILRVDPKFDDTITLEQALEQNPDAIFLCLPTPSRSDGTCDVSSLEETMCKLIGFSSPVISHSTAPWTFYEYWQYRISNLVHVPEFVTAADARAQYANQTRLVVGGTVTATNNAMMVLETLLPGLEEKHLVKIGEAAFVKYMSNCFLAMKVIFANQMSVLSSAAGMDWNAITQTVAKDTRLGHTHWQVPGPDGNRGYGGMCFPKDMDAMLTESDRLGIGLSLLEETKRHNQRLRQRKVT